MKKGCLYFHQGWADIINSLALINYYSSQYNELKVLMRADARPMIDFYTSHLPNVYVIYLDKGMLDSGAFMSFVDVDCDYLFHGYHDSMRKDQYQSAFGRDIYYVKGFYSYYNINPVTRVDLFDFKRNFELENEKYEEFVKNNGSDYILYHDDPNRNINLSLDKNESLKYINLNGISDNIFDQIKILENAKEIHLVDSIWAAFCYLLDAKYEIFKLRNKNIYLYPYQERSGALLESHHDKFIEPVNLDNWIIK